MKRAGDHPHATVTQKCPGLIQDGVELLEFGRRADPAMRDCHVSQPARDFGSFGDEQFIDDSLSFVVGEWLVDEGMQFAKQRVLSIVTVCHQSVLLVMEIDMTSYREPIWRASSRTPDCHRGAAI